MKKIKIIHLFTAITLVVLFASCKKDFLEVSPRGQFLTENYYSNQEQAYGALIGVYDVLRKNSGGFENMISFMNAGSDDQFAGGGGPDDGAGIQAFSNHTLTQLNMPA